jgi:large subunit ribosomal protein L6
MSRIGNRVIKIPDGVEVISTSQEFTVKGKLGQLSCVIPDTVGYSVEDGEIRFTRSSNLPQHRANHGLARALVNNLVVGVTEGFKKQLELEGTGYKWEVKGSDVVMSLGYSHQVIIPVPADLKVEITGGRCLVSGIDKQRVGFMAATIRSKRRVEPYKGKGIRYTGEYVRRKAGKAGA